MVVAHSRGLFHLDAPVAEYWPEFAQAGKERITVRQLLTHQAGLISLDESLTVETLADHDRLARISGPTEARVAAGNQARIPHPDARLVSERVIAAGRSARPDDRSSSSRKKLPGPLGVQFYIGLPIDIAEEHLATTEGFHRLELLRHLGDLPVAMVLAGLWPRSLVARSVNLLRLNNPAHIGSPEYRRLEIPAANGFGQARAVAKIYSVAGWRRTRAWHFACHTTRTVGSRQRRRFAARIDTVLKIDTKYGFGFSRPSSAMRFGSDASAFGCPGAGGCFGMADPSEKLGFAYVTNKMGFHLFDDPRERACREACNSCLAALRNMKQAA